MAIDRLITIKEPHLFDRCIVGIQQGLAEQVGWLDHIFGRAERLVKEVEGMRRYTPNIYLGRDEYLCLLPDERLGNYCFFTTDDPENVEWSAGERSRLSVTFSLIVWCDLRTVEDEDVRNRERVKSELLSLLNGGIRLRFGHFQIQTIYEKAENVFTGFTTDEVQNQFLMAPYAGWRFEGVMMCDEECVM